MERAKKIRIVAAVIVLCAVCASVPIALWASNSAEPTIGNESNAVDNALISSAGVNVTDVYDEEGNIKVEPNMRGVFGELIFGATNTYNYSADVTFSADSTTYGSIRLVLGEGIKSTNIKKTIEVCIRPNIGDVVLFATGSGENPLWHGNAGKSLEIGKTYRYTVQYASGKVSFWLDGNRIFHDVDVSETLSDIKLYAGYYSQGCTGYLSNVQIWGDVTSVMDQVDTNVANTMKVQNNGTNVTASYRDTGIVQVSENGSGTFDNLVYGTTNRYVISTDITYTSDSSTYGSIRLIVGKGTTSTGEDKTMEVCIRPNLNQALVGTTSNGRSEKWLHVVSVPGLEFNKAYRHTILYDNGKLTFWVDGNMIVNQADMGGTLSNMAPTLGFYSQKCVGTISNILICGDVSGFRAPVFNSSTDTNVLEQTVLLDSTDTAKSFDENMGVAYTEENSRTTVRYGFAGVEYGSSYYFSARAKFMDNTSKTPWNSEAEYDFEGLRFQVATAKKDGVDYKIEVGVRKGLFTLFANDTAFATSREQNNAYNTDVLYSVRYKENNRFDFFQGEIPLYSDFDLTTHGYTDIRPCVGIGGEVCAFSFADMKLWGDVTVDPEKVPEMPEEPMFDSTADSNLMKQVVVENPITGKLSVLDDCAVSTGEGYTADSRMTLYGVEYGESYNFTTSASFSDNTSIRSGSEVNWEGLIFQLATVEKDGNEYNMEVRVRNGLVCIFVGNTAYAINRNVATSYDTVNRYTVEYREDNTISFFKNGEAVYFKYDITSEGYTNVTPKFGFGGEVCSYNYTGMKLWGDITFNEELVPEIPKEEIFDADTDINLMEEAIVVDPSSGKTGVLADCTLITKKDYVATGNAEIKGISYGDYYNFSTKATFFDNTNMQGENEVNWEGLVFNLATVEKDGTTYQVNVRFRNNLVAVFVGNTPYAVERDKGTDYGTENQYTVSYNKDGTFSVFQNGNVIYYKYDITEEGYTNVQPSFAFGGEVCAYSYQDMKLWGDLSLEELPGVPKKPESNGDYADYMRVPTNNLIKYEDGNVYSTTDELSGRSDFQHLPFDAEDTYVFGFNINTKKAEQKWMGPRISIGMTADGKRIELYIMADTIGVFVGGVKVETVSLGRELNKVYRIDMLIEPEAVSVWVDNLLLIDKCTLPHKTEVKTGILFEKALAVMSHIDLYYTDVVKFVAPEVPEPPVYKTLADGQFNAADWMQVTKANQKYNGYFENKLSSTNSTIGEKYIYTNLPITDDMSYYYSATYVVTESTQNWKGPRFIFRHDADTPFYMAVLQDSIVILAGSKRVASVPLKMKLGNSYDIVMYSTPTEISAWVDGVLIFESVDLTPFITTKLSAKLGILFELCRANVSNLAIYGDKIVFNEAYIDAELYYNKYYNMKGVPAMKGLNLFQNITVTDVNGGSIGAKFDAEKNVVTTEFNNGSGKVNFVDAKGSSNLNGLKNKSEYVFAFKYRVDDWEAEAAGDSGFWVTLNDSAGPWTKASNSIRVGFSGNDVMLNVYQENKVITEQLTKLKRENGKTYDVAIVHGKNWIKLYVDNELKIVSTDLPTYDIAFKIAFTNMQSEIKDIKLYELEDSGLRILETEAQLEKNDAGNTINDAEEYAFYSRIKAPVAVITIAANVVVLSLVAIICIVVNELKKRQTKTKMGGETSCKKE